MTRLLAISSAWLLCIASVAFGAEPVPEKKPDQKLPNAAAAEPDPLQFEVAFVELPRPIRIRLNVTVNNKPWKPFVEEVNRRYTQTIFNVLDTNQDKFLTATEARSIPGPTAWPSLPNDPDVHVAFSFAKLDTDGDGKATLAEYEKYMQKTGTTSLRNVTLAAYPYNVDLFSFLDVNRDRVLEAAEWNSTDALMNRDQDRNGIITINELAVEAANPAGGPQEFAAAGTFPRAKKPNASDTPTVDPAPDVELSVNYRETNDRVQRPQVRLKITPTAPAGLQVEPSVASEPVLLVAGRRLVFRVPPCVFHVQAARRQQLVTEFKAIIQGRAEESITLDTPLSPQLTTAFPIADRNRDGKLELAEIENYANVVMGMHLATESTQLQLVRTSERWGLMPIADLNMDGNLNRREIESLPQRIAAIADKSTKLARNAIPRTIVYTLVRSTTPVHSRQYFLGNSAPIWFRRFDRNQDGDLDQQEFPGSVEEFQRMDTNGDKWIDADEAALSNYVPPDQPAAPPGRRPVQRQPLVEAF